MATGKAKLVRDPEITAGYMQRYGWVHDGEEFEERTFDLYQGGQKLATCHSVNNSYWSVLNAYTDIDGIEIGNLAGMTVAETSDARVAKPKAVALFENRFAEAAAIAFARDLMTEALKARWRNERGVDGDVQESDDS